MSIDRAANVRFGTWFPTTSDKGDIFIRVDVMPNKLYKFNGERWIEIPKSNTTVYLDNQEYIKYLINEIDNKRIELDDLSQQEQAEIANYQSQSTTDN